MPKKTPIVSMEDLIARYVDGNPLSQAMAGRAKRSLPGGNTRTGVYIDPFPIYIEHGEGPYLIDIDGHRLIDFVNNNTALILGHAHPTVVESLQKQIGRGTAFSRPTPLEVEMAELLKERVPSLERIRFCSSGSEAVLNALRASRAFTNRRKIAKFEGAYHGVDAHAMISYRPPLGPDLGSSEHPHSVPSSAGLPPNTAEEVIVLPFNDIGACAEIIEDHAYELAAVIVDPISTGAGLALPEDGFLTHLREITERNGILLIFDEIISFRTAPGGAQELFGVRPDLTTLGKTVAGGTAGSVVGGRADIMDLYNPTSGNPKIPHSGTYNAWPIAMVAGLTTLRLLTPKVYETLGASAQRIGVELNAAFEETGITARVVVAGSLFKIHFLSSIPRNYREAAAGNELMHKWLSFWLLNHGINWAEHGNISLAMQDSDVDLFISTVKESLPHLREIQ